MLTRAEIPGLLCAAILVAVGLFLIFWHWRSWKRVADDPEQATEFRWSQCRRRIQVAAMLVGVGILLCIGDTILPILERNASISLRRMAVLWACDVLVMLLLAAWIALLALGDMAATASRTRIDLLRMRQRERALCEEIERYREIHGDADS